jgi:hypothetical protein
LPVGHVVGGGNVRQATGVMLGKVMSSVAKSKVDVVPAAFRTTICNM